MILHDYWRSSACYRVRIALELKGLTYSKHAIDIAPGADEQQSDEFLVTNPAGLVPVLEHEGLVLNQSMAILDYLEDRFPETSLLPAQPKLKYKAKALALDVACDIHPLNNLRVLQYLQQQLQVDEETKLAWYHHWLAKGFGAIEKQIAHHHGKYSMGDNVTLVDVCLIPQLYNAHRFGFDLKDYPFLRTVEENCLSLTAFQQAAPKELE